MSSENQTPEIVKEILTDDVLFDDDEASWEVCMDFVEDMSDDHVI